MTLGSGWRWGCESSALPPGRASAPRLNRSGGGARSLAQMALQLPVPLDGRGPVTDTDSGWLLGHSLGTHLERLASKSQWCNFGVDPGDLGCYQHPRPCEPRRAIRAGLHDSTLPRACDRREVGHCASSLSLGSVPVVRSCAVRGLLARISAMGPGRGVGVRRLGVLASVDVPSVPRVASS